MRLFLLFTLFVNSAVFGGVVATLGRTAHPGMLLLLVINLAAYALLLFTKEALR